MAGRCLCPDLEQVGAAAVLTDCLDVEGAGTGPNPWLVSPIVDPDPANTVSCGAGGLGVFTPLGLEVVGPIDGSRPRVGGAWPDFATTNFYAIAGELDAVVSNAVGLFPVAWPCFANGIACIQFSAGATVVDPHLFSPPIFALNDINLCGGHLVVCADDGVATPQNPSSIVVELLIVGW